MESPPLSYDWGYIGIGRGAIVLDWSRESGRPLWTAPGSRWFAGWSAPGRRGWDWLPALDREGRVASIHTILRLPLWMLIIPLALLTRRAFLRTRVPAPGLCPNCNYDLSASPTGQCPECGSVATR